MSESFVYILTNDRKTVLYVGCTSNLKNRVYLHRHRLIAGFSKKYNLIRLIHYEMFPDMHAARQRENALKDGPRKRKLALISANNPEWKDLYINIYVPDPDVEK